MYQIIKALKYITSVSLVLGELLLCFWLIFYLIPYLGGGLLGGVLASSIGVLCIMIFALINQFIGL